MSVNHVTVIALGPGRRGALTVDALEALRAAPCLYLYAVRSPLLSWLRDELPAGALVHGFDGLWKTADTDFDELWKTADTGIERATRMAETLLDAALQGPVAYGVLGHLPDGDLAVRLLRAGATRRGLGVRVIGGLAGTSLESGAVALQAASLQVGSLQVIAAPEITTPGPARTGAPGLAGRWMAPANRLLDAQTPLLVEQIDGPRGLAAVGRWLLARYPSEHVVTLWPGPDGSAAQLTLSALDETAPGRLPADRHPLERHPADQRLLERVAAACCLYVPPLAPLDDGRAVSTLGYVTARLRGPGGCPWDREQTHASLTPYMIEEAYEAVDAIERDDTADMIEELGDVLLQVVLHSQLAEEAGRFSIDDVADEVNRKLVRRHPHVFGDTVARTSSEVLRNWERIKRAEKGERRASALDGIPAALPALSLAQTMGRKAAKLGFDWPDAAGVLAKVGEELDEIGAAASDDERRDEMGDLLFALTSACRHLGIDAEGALRAATHKFAARFRCVEELTRERGLDLAVLDAARLDALWEEAKALP